MNKYEAMYIIKPTVEAEARTALIQKFSDLLTANGGQVESVEEPGMKKLAYEINGFGRGVYVLLVFKGSQTVIKELDRVAKLTDEILRHMIIRKGY